MLAKLGFPEGVNIALAGAFFGKLFEMREKWLELADMYGASPEPLSFRWRYAEAVADT